MARDHLSERMRQGGAALLATTDDLAMQAQGALWLFDHDLEDWRYYLVTSLVDTLGRRKTYRLLIEAFECSNLPQDMTVEDVHLVNPMDPVFQFVSKTLRADDGIIELSDFIVSDISFDAVIYRTLRTMPTSREAASIEKRFSKRVQELSRVAGLAEGRDAQTILSQ